MKAKDVERGTAVQASATDADEAVVGDGKVVAVRQNKHSGLITFEYEVTVRRSFGPFRPYDRARGVGAEAVE